MVTITLGLKKKEIRLSGMHFHTSLEVSSNRYKSNSVTRISIASGLAYFVPRALKLLKHKSINQIIYVSNVISELLHK